jgi:hypothetical protein
LKILNIHIGFISFEYLYEYILFEY